jgi:hypothetical protein
MPLTSSGNLLIFPVAELALNTDDETTFATIPRNCAILVTGLMQPGLVEQDEPLKEG